MKKSGKWEINFHVKEIPAIGSKRCLLPFFASIASLFFKVELKLALETNIVINLDNDSEIRMVDDLLNGELKAKVDSGEVVPRVGLRVNPVVGGGAIAIIATATKYSKFGIPIMDETRQMVIDLYKANEWLTGIHIHVGSQGVPLEKFVSGAKVCSLPKKRTSLAFPVS